MSELQCEKCNKNRKSHHQGNYACPVGPYNNRLQTYLAFSVDSKYKPMVTRKSNWNSYPSTRNTA